MKNNLPKTTTVGNYKIVGPTYEIDPLKRFKIYYIVPESQEDRLLASTRSLVLAHTFINEQISIKGRNETIRSV